MNIQEIITKQRELEQKKKQTLKEKALNYAAIASVSFGILGFFNPLKRLEDRLIGIKELGNPSVHSKQVAEFLEIFPMSPGCEFLGISPSINADSILSTYGEEYNKRLEELQKKYPGQDLFLQSVDHIKNLSEYNDAWSRNGFDRLVSRLGFSILPILCGAAIYTSRFENKGGSKK
ncbi:MAG: hypothetical protein Q8N63_04400 [Nanoarchaeota archaeon]|nr:hypothetical protein [Nanoarchaeota archaeon]